MTRPGRVLRERRGKMLPLRAQVYIRQRDRLVRGGFRNTRTGTLSRREFKAMLWEHSALDVVYNIPGDDGGTALEPHHFVGDLDDEIPF